MGVIEMGGRVGPITLNDKLRAEYDELFHSCKPLLYRLDAADRVIHLLTRNKSRYLYVGDPLGIPWWWIAITHSLESSLDFNTHLHNGDSLSSRTVNWPVGRPRDGNPPFTWEQSATDALTKSPHRLNEWDDWSAAGCLFQWEKYNGFGYRRRSVPSPYLWASSNHYQKGKFVRDGKYDPNFVSRQIGAGTLLRRLVDQGVVFSSEPSTD